MDLIFQQLGLFATIAVWDDFGAAIGADTLRACYGPRWPRPVADGEFVWSVTAPREIVAWASIRRDPVEPWAWYAAGVWPAWQRRGVVHEIRAWALKMIAGWPDVDGLVIEVLDTNPGWQQAMRSEAARGSAMRAAGRIEIPGAEAQLFWVPKERA